ncbi:putative Chloride intracellular channel protein 6 [Hypsibius exemplaris]|uniref:Chloride intracellular channel protein 6 n=1 Tax=Hypsibius exemplaris TaxID=2072580 RepID=A0A1W0WPX0_HYPEX|nr:putative Chloride intracellular channel protein 6 [Hypsibius exemplaris]
MAVPPALPPKPPIKLFVKAGVDGASYGACPLSQRIYMILSLKSAIGGYNFTVYAVNPAKPSDEFKALGLRLVPSISYLQDNLDNLDEILEYIDNNFPKCDLSYDNILAEKACKDVFSKFCFFIKAVSKDAFGLTTELEKLDKFLSGKPPGKGPFMCGSQLTYLDCELLPKLQQIRVAGRDLKGFEIPAALTGVWNYLKAAYATDAFRTTCPSDEEITLHWMERTETGLTVGKPQRRKSALMNATEHRYSFHTPLDQAVAEETRVPDSGSYSSAEKKADIELATTPVVAVDKPEGPTSAPPLSAPILEAFV